MSLPLQDNQEPKITIEEAPRKQRIFTNVERVNPPDRYCMMIISRYFNSIGDYVNIEKCCKEYRGITEQFHYNPIAIKNVNMLKKYFKNAETYYFYSNPINGKLKSMDTLQKLQNYNVVKKIIIPGLIDEDEADKALKDKNINDTRIVFKEKSTKFKENMNEKIEILDGVDQEFRKDENKNKLTDVTIPKHITRLATGCFQDYDDTIFMWNPKNHWPFTKIDVPSTVSEMGHSCFMNCANLREVSIPSTISSLNDFTFSHCYNLSKINVPSDIKSIGKDTFEYCTTLKEVSIPSTVSEIGESCFESCSSLSEIQIPRSINRISNSCFSYCTTLTSITIPNSIISLGKCSLSGCSNISEIVIPDSIVELPDSCFDCCNSLIRVKLPINLFSIGAWCFRNCPNLRDMSNSLAELKDLATDPKSHGIIRLPSTLTSLGGDAFRCCSSIERVTILSPIERIEDFTFSDCANLSSINIPSTVTSIGTMSFARCPNLPSIYIPSTVKRISTEFVGNNPNIKIIFQQGSLIYSQFNELWTRSSQGTNQSNYNNPFTNW